MFSFKESREVNNYRAISKLGIDVGAIYRHINNPLIDKLILEKRNITIKDSKTFYTPKGKESAKEIIKAINDKLSIILLIDQKDSAGENCKISLEYTFKNTNRFF